MTLGAGTASKHRQGERTPLPRGHRPHRLRPVDAVEVGDLDGGRATRTTRMSRAA
jgi:hypothetical protein